MTDLNVSFEKLNFTPRLEQTFLAVDGTILFWNYKGLKTFSLIEGNYQFPTEYEPPEINLPQPIYWWRFNDDLVDGIAGKDLHQEFADYNFVSGKFGNALNFYTVATLSNDTLSYSLSTDFAFSAWIKGSQRYLWNDDSGNATRIFNFDIELTASQASFNIGSNYSFYSYNSASSSYTYSYDYSSASASAIPISAEDYHHLVVNRTYNNSQTITQVYLDNTLVFDDTNNSSVLVGRDAIAKNFSLARLLNRPSGSIDDLQLFDRALSTREIQALYEEIRA